jgi:hypothetical protein
MTSLTDLEDDQPIADYFDPTKPAPECTKEDIDKAVEELLDQTADLERIESAFFK